MPKYSDEQTQYRYEEIIDACERLYQTMTFNEITLKDIAALTTFSRPSIYNYFHTKEEIFLVLLQREHQKWINDLNDIANTNDNLSAESFADRLAHSLESRVQMLKLMSMNLYAIEDNSRFENLISFKVTYGEACRSLNRCLQKYCPNMTHGSQTALSTYLVHLNGEGSSADVVSRSVARDNSYQKFDAKLIGNAACSGHTECDSIIMDSGKILAVLGLEANNVDAALVHEAAIGKIAGDQIIKLMTLGLTEQEAEEQIINGFLK